MDLRERIRVWVLRHRSWSAVLSAAMACALVLAGLRIAAFADRPTMRCGPGMSVAGSPHSCVGLDLDGTSFAKSEPAALRSLQQRVHDANAKTKGPYVSVVLLLNFSPIANVDTETNARLVHAVEGAMTAVWRAEHTGDLGGGLHIRLLLANMGSQYASWDQAVEAIGAHAKSEHISGVIGLGQSTIETRRAAAKISAAVKIPVIGTTVTADTMNTDPDTGKQITDFFRVSSTNTDAAKAARHYLEEHHQPLNSVAIVEDTAARDDYTKTLAAAAEKELHGTRVLPYSGPDSLPAGVKRDEVLSQQFKLLHDTLCQNPPSAIFFAGRGSDLGTFVNSWYQGSACGGKLTLLSGDDASIAIKDPYIEQAVTNEKLTIVFPATGSPDEWGTCSTVTPAAELSPAKVNFYQFWSAFTGRHNPCSGAQPRSNDGSPSLDFPAGDLSDADAMLTYDAAVTAVAAARYNVQTVLSYPEGQVAVMHQFTCQHMVAGSSGWIAFNRQGNAVNKPIPLLRIDPKGTARQIELFWPTGKPLLRLPTAHEPQVQGC